MLSVILSSELLNISPRIEADAYVFDIEHFNDDVSNAINHITNLKRHIFDKPLILIGEKFQLNEILDQENIKGLVRETIDKPLSNGQLLSAINACMAANRSRFGFFKFLKLDVERMKAKAYEVLTLFMDKSSNRKQESCLWRSPCIFNQFCLSYRRVTGISWVENFRKYC